MFLKYISQLDNVVKTTEHCFLPQLHRPRHKVLQVQNLPHEAPGLSLLVGHRRSGETKSVSPEHRGHTGGGSVQLQSHRVIAKQKRQSSAAARHLFRPRDAAEHFLQ